MNSLVKIGYGKQIFKALLKVSKKGLKSIREKPEDEFRNTYILEFHELEEYLFDT